MKMLGFVLAFKAQYLTVGYGGCAIASVENLFIGLFLMYVSLM